MCKTNKPKKHHTTIKSINFLIINITPCDKSQPKHSQEKCVCVVVSAVSDGSTDDMVDMEEIPAASIHRWTNTITYYCSI